jgi:hypothetical protein
MSGTVTIEADHTPPRVRIDTTAQTVTRLDDGATEAVTVRGSGSIVGGVIYDYECPQEMPVTYSDGDGLDVTVELPNVGDWLIHLGTPELSCLAVIRQHSGAESPLLQSVADIPGGPTFVNTFGPRASERGSFTVNTYSPDETAALRALLADGTVLFLNSHADLGFGPAYISVGTVDWSRRFNWTGDDGRVWSLPYVEVDRPESVQAVGDRIEDLVGTIAGLSGTIADLGR